jgi:protein SCO1/2
MTCSTVSRPLFPLPRRQIVGLLGLSILGRAAPAAAAFPPGSAIAGALPPLAFTMRRSSDGEQVTATAYRGFVVVLYFGFTRCPDICPLTMQNLGQIMHRMGPSAQAMRVLFVTVDPAHDTLPRLKAYLAKFGSPPLVDGLRGTPEELAALTKRYFVLYQAPTGSGSSDPASAITHTSYAYVFGPRGRVRDLLADLGSPGIDVSAMAAGFTQLVKESIDREPRL